jgi:transcriptional regulator GlxA family with amidase domain
LEIAILLYDGFTALDAVGPYEVLRFLPGADVRFVAAEPGPTRADTKMLNLDASYGLSDCPRPEILVVPGGPGHRSALGDERVLAWLRAAHASSRWTTSVCSGSLILGAAGLLNGLRATSHWLRLDELRAFGAEPTGERVVLEGKVVTAAGVSAGIDMALRLVALEAGDQLAQAVQLAIEYDPQPPFDAGSPARAPADIVEAARQRAGRSPSQQPPVLSPRA